MNDLLIKELEKLLEQIKYEVVKSKDQKEKFINNIRLKNTVNLIKIIKNYPTKIKSGDELKNIKGIGKNSVKRINEILEKGKLSEINIDRTDKKILNAINELTKIYGIGESIAIKLIKEYNIYTIKELKKAYYDKKVPLNDHIILGLKYEKVYERKIPRQEISEIDKFLKKIIKKTDKNLLHIICGSYRREKLESNDIDVLLVNKNIKTKEQLDSDINYLKIIINKLKEQKFIIDDIDKNYQVKYMGFCKYKDNPIRHIDIMYIPYESYWSAVLHFTGSGNFNEKMRHHAKLLGYKLNQYGLFKKELDKKSKILKRIEINSEKDIFNVLNMEYIEPKYRD